MYKYCSFKKMKYMQHKYLNFIMPDIKSIAYRLNFSLIYNIINVCIVYAKCNSFKNIYSTIILIR